MGYQDKKKEAWKWEEGITTFYDRKLRDAAFENINCRHYMIKIVEADDKWDCRVTRVGKGHRERKYFFMKELEQGLAFGGCSCGKPYTCGIPCHHMVAVIKSSQIEGLTPTNAMPYWWFAEFWRDQYPIVTIVTCDFDLETL